MADRVAQIDERLNIIGNREIATQNEQLLNLLAHQERLALTNERISLTSPAPAPAPAPAQGNYYLHVLHPVNINYL
jgi:hypothetical protein